MHLVLNRKQFSHVNPSQLSAQTSTLHVKKGQLRINSVTIVRKIFSEVYGVFGSCTAHLVGFQLCLLCADNEQQMENANWWGVLLKRQD